jgi:hypothetical protein
MRAVAEQLGWLVINSGPILHSAAIGPKLWEASARPYKGLLGWYPV